MLERYLGEDTFRAGIRKYMADHAYGSTTTADLWRALAAASGKPVASIAATFTEQAGVPLVVAQARCEGEEQRITLRQERYTIRDPAPAPRRWQVPVAIGPLRALRGAETVLLTDEPREIAAGRCGEPVKLNLGDVGYYRVEYDAAARAALAKSLSLMSAADRLNLIADSWALVEAGRAEPATYLELIEEIAGDDARAVWEQVIGTFSWLDWLARNRPERAAVGAYARAKLRPVLDRLGWDAAATGGDDEAVLRARLIRVLGALGDQEIVAEARRRFDAFRQDPASLKPALRDAVTSLVGRTADRATYETLLALARAEELIGFAPAQATSGGRIVVARAQETILTNAELKARVLPAIDAWIKRRNGARE
jgi:aminopeptidase N